MLELEKENSQFDFNRKNNTQLIKLSKKNKEYIDELDHILQCQGEDEDELTVWNKIYLGSAFVLILTFVFITIYF